MQNNLAELLTALVNAKKQFPSISKDKTTTAMKGGRPYSYASLESILGHLNPILSENGLTLQFNQKIEGNLVITTCRLWHVSGQFIEASMPKELTEKNCQEMGSLRTYMSRYTACMILGINPEDDDDGQESVSSSNKEAPKQGAPSINMTKGQVDVLEGLLNGDLEKKKTILNHYQVNELSEIPAKNYNFIANKLARKNENN